MSEDTRKLMWGRVTFLEPVAIDTKHGRAGAPKDKLELARLYTDEREARVDAKSWPSSVYSRRVQPRDIRSNGATLRVYVLTVRRRFGL